VSRLLAGDGPPGRLYLRAALTPFRTLELPPPKLCLVTIAAACGALFFLACGVQRPPQPPRIEQPESVTDLAVSQIGRTLELSFALPSQATDGERLTKPLEVRIFRLITLPGQKPSGTPATPDLWLVLLPDDLRHSVQDEKTILPIRFSDQEFKLWQGATFTFSLRALTRGFRHRPVESELSNAAQTTLLDVSGPVEDLQVHVGEKALELSWPLPGRVASYPALPKPTSYHVYRSRTGKPGSFQLLGESALPRYLDPDFEFNRTLFYKVRAVFRQAGSTAESEDSSVVEITPRDIFPPAAPSNLSAIYTTQAVELIWAANSEPDLGGYNVYRHEEGGAFQKLNPESLRTPLFRDAGVEPGRTYFYRATAVDLTNNESVPSAEIRVDTQ